MSDEQQPQTTTPDTLRETPLASTISDSLSTAIAAQTGTSAQNIANQIQQAVPFKEIIEQLKNEIDQSGTQLQDEIAQQALIQQAIANFGSPTSQTTTTHHTTTADTPDTKKAQVSTELQQPEEMNIDGATPSTPASETPTGPEEGQKKQETDTEPNQTAETPSDKSSKPSVDNEDEADTDVKDVENTQTNNSNAKNQTNGAAPQNTSQTQQQAQIQQQTIENISRQQLKNKLTQLQQEKRKLQKKLLDEADTKKAFGIDQAALFVPALTTIAYIVDLIDFTEFIAPFFDIVVAVISTYWRMTRSIKLKLFYFKQLPGFLFARLLGMIPIVSYIAPELLEEIKSFIKRINKFRKAHKSIKPLKKRIEQIDIQIKNVQKQLSNTSFLSKLRRRN